MVTSNQHSCRVGEPTDHGSAEAERGDSVAAG